MKTANFNFIDFLFKNGWDVVTENLKYKFCQFRIYIVGNGKNVALYQGNTQLTADNAKMPKNNFEAELLLEKVVFNFDHHLVSIGWDKVNLITEKGWIFEKQGKRIGWDEKGMYCKDLKNGISSFFAFDTPQNKNAADYLLQNFRLL